jgi:hypothetical protein
MRIVLLVLVSLLAACSTAVPVTQSFPDAPAILMEKCPELKIIQGEKVSIVDFTKTVSENYTTYYECSARNSAWQEWYTKQKKIWDDAQ